MYGENGYLTEVLDYDGPVVYRDGAPDYILTGEGRLVFREEKEPVYEYFLTDHLGNTRVTFRVEGNSVRVVQENHYYPFGLSMAGLDYSGLPEEDATQNPYLYNSKEFQGDEGLGWYDYGARFYDAQVGRWWSVDPMAEQYISWSTYLYVRNNPIRRLDSNGKNDDDFFFTKKGELVAYVENDETDRVFIAKDDEEIYKNLDHAADENMYNQVTMSEEEIEERMNNNGFKKVIEESKFTEINKHQYHPAEMGGFKPIILVIPIDKKETVLDYMYIDKSKVQIGYSTSNIRQGFKILEKEMSVEYTTYSTRTYQYGNKRQLFGVRGKRTAKKVGQTGMKIIPWESVSKVIQKMIR